MQTALLADSLLVMNETIWGPKMDMGRKYWCAHMATVNQRRGTGGAIQSQSVGQVSRSYALSVAAGRELFSSTSYGIIYEGLLMSLASARFEIA